jgi:uncharacterized SAM-binding protein YcdF (DUF218 family)
MRTLLTSPLGWCLLIGLLALCLRWRDRGRPVADRSRRALRAFIASWCLLLAFACPYMAVALERSLVQLGARWPAPPAWSATQAPDAILVFGGGLEGAASPTAPLGPSSRERLLAALEAAARWPDAIVIFSGGSPRGGPGGSGERIAQEAERLGLPRARIVVEPAARDTRGNAVLSADLLRQRGSERVAVVTSPMHVARSRGAMQGVGFATLAAGPPAPKFSLDASDLLPNADALARSTAAVHEWIGLAYYKLRGWI